MMLLFISQKLFHLWSLSLALFTLVVSVKTLLLVTGICFPFIAMATKKGSLEELDLLGFHTERFTFKLFWRLKERMNFRRRPWSAVHSKYLLVRLEED